MTLRRKLLAVFGGLAIIALFLDGLTLWTTARWTETDKRLESHYARSLQVQRVRAGTFQAMKEVAEALLGDSDARTEFAAALAPVGGDLARWAELADTPAEREQVTRVQEAHRRLIEEAEQVFALVNRGARADAVRLAEGLEDEAYARFAEVTDTAVKEDRIRRKEVQASVEGVRQTARTILLIAAVATISLVLLLTAYLATDLFRPLRRVERGLERLAGGDFDVRLGEGRRDEIGVIHHAFDGLAEALKRRDTAIAYTGPNGPARDDHHDAQGGPPRVALHALLAQMRARIALLRTETLHDSAHGAAALAEVEGMAIAASRAADFGLPLDLDLEQTDLRDLLYSVHARFRGEFSRCRVGSEVWVDPSLEMAILDRLKLREALSEAVRNALAAMPERGGRIGLRVLRTPTDGTVLIEVADDGSGMPPEAVRRAVDTDPFEGGPGGRDGTRRPRVGLALARSVAERHGGRLEVLSEPGVGTVVRFALPLRE